MIGDRLSRSALFLVSEFVVIVLGVLVALGVDEWREAQKQREVREQLIAGLIADLEGDRRDYEQVRNMGRRRLQYCRALLAAPVDGTPVDLPGGVTLGDAVYGAGFWNRLETNFGTYSEMTSSGAGLAIQNIELRLQISKYYARAINRADLNDLLEDTGSRFINRLHELGFSPSERDVAMVFQNYALYPHMTVRGNLSYGLKTIEAISPYVERVTQELLDANAVLLERLKEVQDASGVR